VRKVLGAKRRERLDKNLRHEADACAERPRERARMMTKRKETTSRAMPSEKEAKKERRRAT
jgi:hypothetical protein